MYKRIFYLSFYFRFYTYYIFFIDSISNIQLY
ncbi:hypothetical protein predicted by Glimmer/Critica [Salmonella enterica subsp. enterica serovar Weltevreden str. 2007-60-3289-1]|nr:hypothetical protein predicted by Glimmer/Critica [Salmonella enterica subsp. enterica serovar Weltevreden str. 2007-60-3289-1]